MFGLPFTKDSHPAIRYVESEIKISKYQGKQTMQN